MGFPDVKAFKAVTIFLVLAIANPLCCCLGLDGIVEIVSSESEIPEMHSCCSASSENSAESSEETADHMDCPHDLQRVAQIVDGDTGLQVFKPQCVGILRFELVSNPSVELKTKATALAETVVWDLAKSAQHLSKAHCVYLL